MKKSGLLMSPAGLAGQRSLFIYSNVLYALYSFIPGSPSAAAAAVDKLDIYHCPGFNGTPPPINYTQPLSTSNKQLMPNITLLRVSHGVNHAACDI